MAYTFKTSNTKRLPGSPNYTLPVGAGFQFTDATATAVVSGVEIADGADQDLVVPNGAMELVIANSDLYFEEDTASCLILAGFPYPVAGMEGNTITIANDTGSAVDLSFFFIMGV